MDDRVEFIFRLMNGWTDNDGNSHKGFVTKMEEMKSRQNVIGAGVIVTMVTILVRAGIPAQAFEFIRMLFKLILGDVI